MRTAGGKRLRKTQLTTLVGGLPCGMTATQDLVCVEHSPAIADHPDDRIIMPKVRAAAAGDMGNALFMLDADGRLHCHGYCGGDGGLDATDTLLIVPLRESPRER